MPCDHLTGARPAHGAPTSADSERDAAEPFHDALYADAVKIVVLAQRGSISLLQRTLQIGYTRATRLIDAMGEDGIVGEPRGCSAREVLIQLGAAPPAAKRASLRRAVRPRVPSGIAANMTLALVEEIVWGILAHILI